MMEYDERVNVLNFFSFSGTPLDLLWAVRLAPYNTTTPTPIFFNDGTVLPMIVASVLACPVNIEYSFKADSCAAGAPSLSALN
jgi:hypothetical protein